MGEAIGEGFVDHQSGIANARTRSADASIGQPTQAEGAKTTGMTGSRRGAADGRLFDQFQCRPGTLALALWRFRIVQRIRRHAARHQRITQCLQFRVGYLI
jgi:hypothetical protein